jgi:hypothetical protein
MTKTATIAAIHSEKIAAVLVQMSRSNTPEVAGEATVRAESECVVREPIGQTVVRYGFRDGSRVERGPKGMREI